ncbi:phage holin family protein [Cellvibrio sp. ARAG 10.3]|uniref:phage holin family protein n=1 Tax=Cellvibrio sp. ARAG 10.3 TaxID=3451358 RepID=UPI003F456FE6
MITGLRNLKANAAMLLDRVELYSKLVAAETKIETSLIIRRLIWVGVGAVFALFALAMAHVAILASFWHTEFQAWAVAGVLFVDVVIAGLAIYMASRPAKQEAFAVTKHHLAEDIKFLKESL